MPYVANQVPPYRLLNAEEVYESLLKLRVDTLQPDSNPTSRSISLREWNWDLINPRYRHLVANALKITGGAAIAMALPWTFSRVWGGTVLAGVAYGIANDLIACRVCPEYFTVGHIYDGEHTRARLVKTLDPNVNAVTWGMVATTPFTLVAGAALAFGATVRGAAQQTVLTSIAGIAAASFLVAEIGSRWARARLECSAQRIYPEVPDEFQSRWHANNVRNSIGYVALAVGTVVLSLWMK